MRRQLEDSFLDTPYGKLLGQIANVAERGKEHGSREMYLDTIRRFGRKDGLEIYRRIRQALGAETEQP